MAKRYGKPMPKDGPMLRLTAHGHIYELRIDLEGSKPPIYRRVRVNSLLTLGDLHAVIQCVMPWEDEHMHEFDLRDGRTTMPASSEGPIRDAAWDTEACVPEDDLTLAQVLQLPDHKWIRYIYDFGDDWVHRVELKKVIEDDAATSFTPQVVTGRRAVPPEDAGGIHNYNYALKCLEQPDHPDREAVLELLQWADDGRWKHDNFNPRQAQERLDAAFT